MYRWKAGKLFILHHYHYTHPYNNMQYTVRKKKNSKEIENPIIPLFLSFLSKYSVLVCERECSFLLCFFYVSSSRFVLIICFPYIPLSFRLSHFTFFSLCGVYFINPVSIEQIQCIKRVAYAYTWTRLYNNSSQLSVRTNSKKEKKEKRKIISPIRWKFKRKNYAHIHNNIRQTQSQIWFSVVFCTLPLSLSLCLSFRLFSPLFFYIISCIIVYTLFPASFSIFSFCIFLYFHEYAQRIGFFKQERRWRAIMAVVKMKEKTATPAMILIICFLKWFILFLPVFFSKLLRRRPRVWCW